MRNRVIHQLNTEKQLFEQENKNSNYTNFMKRCGTHNSGIEELADLIAYFNNIIISDKDLKYVSNQITGELLKLGEAFTRYHAMTKITGFETYLKTIRTLSA